MITLDEKRCYGATAKELAQLRTSIEYVNKVLAHPKFDELCRSLTFTEAEGDSGAFIALNMRQPVTVGVSFYSRWWSKVVGWTNLGSKSAEFVQIHANRKFWLGNSAEEDGSNILHELAHGFGYTHSRKPWFKSVPYRMNFIYEEVMKVIKAEEMSAV